MPGKIVSRSLFATVFAFGCLAANVAATAEAGPAAEVELERLTSMELRARMDAGVDTVIVPAGGTEQNGAHMALGKHNAIVRETARRIAVQLGNAVVAPVLAYVPEGPADRKAGHMAYAGTISLGEDVFEKVLEAAATSFKTHGFRKVVLLGDSGGNQAAQKRLADRLNKAWAGSATVIAASDYYAANGGDAFLSEQGLTADQIGTHAGVRDTSELLYVAPDMVRVDRLAANSEGATGDARLAGAAWGEQLIARKVAAAVAEIRAAASGSGSQAAAQDRGLIGWLLSFVTG